jgi:hypothetical protein
MHRLVASLLLVAGPASAAAPPRSPAAYLNRLVEQLGSGVYRQRVQASKALEALGESALPALSRAAASADIEVRRRALWLLKRQQARLLEVVAALEGAWEKEGESLLVKLSGQHIRDAEVARLKWLNGLTWLCIRHTRVTDKGLAHLKDQTALRRLSLAGTPIGDAGLAHLKGLVNLESLDLDNTRVGDEGLAHLKGFRELRRLYLGGARVTDAGLAHLHGLEKLQHISLVNTKVTPKGIRDLQNALPSLTIEREKR